MTDNLDRDRIIRVLRREALADSEHGWLSDLTRYGLWWSENDQVIMVRAFNGSIDVGHLAEVVESLTDQATESATRRAERAEQAVQRVRELADAWKSRGEHSMKYSETLQWPVAEAIHDGGEDMVNKANLIYQALGGGDQV